MRAVKLELKVNEVSKPYLVTLDDHDHIYDAICLETNLGEQHKGKVIKVIPNQNASILYLEDKTEAYLKCSDVKIGDIIDVTIIREAFDNKPVTVSRDVKPFDVIKYFLDLVNINDITEIEDEFIKNSLSLRVQKELDRALAGIFYFDNGDIKVERTAALTVIDVNASSQSAFDANMSSIDTIVQAIRLLNISGIIIIDFINMKTDENREAVRNSIKKAFETFDYASYKVGKFSEFGLLEITRKRVFSSLT